VKRAIFSRVGHRGLTVMSIVDGEPYATPHRGGGEL
jgi:hypothetical protein